MGKHSYLRLDETLKRMTLGGEDEARDSHGEWTSGGDEGASAGAASSVEEWNKNMPQSVRSVLGSYEAGVNYHDINDALRAGKVSGDAKQIDEAFRTVPVLDKGVTVYRGMAMGNGLVPTVGAEFSDKGFVSVSTKQSIAAKFETLGERSGKAPDQMAIVSVRIPAGAKALDMKYANPIGVSSESELMLNRGSVFVVTSVTGGNGKPYQIKAKLKGSK